MCARYLMGPSQRLGRYRIVFILYVSSILRLGMHLINLKRNRGLGVSDRFLRRPRHRGNWRRRPGITGRVLTHRHDAGAIGATPPYSIARQRRQPMVPHK